MEILEMKTLTVGGKTYEMVDAEARAGIENINNVFGGVTDGKDGYGIYTTTENPPDDNNYCSFTIACINALDGRMVQAGDLILQTTRWEIYQITEIDNTYAYSEYLGCIKGLNGTNGQDGTDGYTPVKGTDYWTDADKTEMVNATLAALPTETWTFTLEDGSTVTKNVVMKS